MGKAMKGTDYGGVKQSNRYFHCSICHFPVDSMRTAVGDGTGADCLIDVEPLYAPEVSSSIYLENMKSMGTLSVDYSPDGSLRDPKRYTAVNITGACPLCGSRNYK